MSKHSPWTVFPFFSRSTLNPWPCLLNKVTHSTVSGSFTFNCFLLPLVVWTRERSCVYYGSNSLFGVLTGVARVTRKRSHVYYGKYGSNSLFGVLTGAVQAVRLSLDHFNEHTWIIIRDVVVNNYSMTWPHPLLDHIKYARSIPATYLACYFISMHVHDSVCKFDGQSFHPQALPKQCISCYNFI